jgi:rhodanese-related sulfurtransferase
MSDEYISVEQLRTLLQGEPQPVVIDVRGDEEFAAGHVPGALHIPGGDLATRLAEIPRGRPVVTY